MQHNKRLHLTARGFGLAQVRGGGPAGAPHELGQLSQRAAGGVWWVHGVRQVSRKPLYGREKNPGVVATRS